MSSNNTWVFSNRWVIEGTLETRSFLHVGSGESFKVPFLAGKKERDEKRKDPVHINAVMADHRGKPMIPGSTLKGNLRSWLGRRVDSKLLEQLFGNTEVTREEDVIGGKAEFHTAFLFSEAPPANHTPNYDQKRATDIRVGIAIDRRTRTVSDKKLFHQQVVPAGAVFSVRITGENIEEEEILGLLLGLEGFNDGSDPVTIGSGTADGWGRMNWCLDKVACVGRQEALRWLEAGEESVGYAIAGRDCTDELRQKVSGLQREEACDCTLRLELELAFDGPFLVNDPSRVVHNEDKKDKTPDHMPRLGPDGKAILPASSFRGAFRSQAERIARTVGKHACRVDDAASRCRPIYSERERRDLCAACRAFGAAGWRTPIEITDFTQIGNAETLVQEFVAIDRFTGGGREGAKFNAEMIVAPTFAGSIAIDLARITQQEAGLLALALRDLLEGDITFGFGSAKGYGACTARIRRATIANAPPWLQKLGIATLNWKESEGAAGILDAARSCVKTFCGVPNE